MLDFFYPWTVALKYQNKETLNVKDLQEKNFLYIEEDVWKSWYHYLRKHSKTDHLNFTLIIFSHDVFALFP